MYRYMYMYMKLHSLLVTQNDQGIDVPLHLGHANVFMK